MTTTTPITIKIIKRNFIRNSNNNVNNNHNNVYYNNSANNNNDNNNNNKNNNNNTNKNNRNNKNEIAITIRITTIIGLSIITRIATIRIITITRHRYEYK